MNLTMASATVEYNYISEWIIEFGTKSFEMGFIQACVALFKFVLNIALITCTEPECLVLQMNSLHCGAQNEIADCTMNVALYYMYM